MRRIIKLGASFVAGAAATELVRSLVTHLRNHRRPNRPKGRTPNLSEGRASPPNLEQAQQVGHGRDADRPREIPLRGWKDILVRTWKEFGDDQIPLMAAGCTFYTLLALFPGVTAVVAMYGLFADVAEAQKHVQAMSAILPAGAITLIGDQMLKVAAAGDGQLSLAFLLGLLTALWSANGAMKAIITGLNIAYEEKEKRGLVIKTLVPLGFTLGLAAFAVTAIGLGAVGAGVSARMGEVAGSPTRSSTGPPSSWASPPE